MPQVSYESTAETLSDKIQFPSFLWTMPSDFYQTKAMAHLIQKSGRNWIGILTTDDDYGLNTFAGTLASEDTERNVFLRTDFLWDYTELGLVHSIQLAVLAFSYASQDL
ncbi:unnamed protein product [Rangifer tarandus platyrhynchus]|uniref:Uncharacterized protein n=1 Tax=Rangifer tarandus platyrhynchus TaxID=3082113 RepID=A0AC59Z211_RANTA